MRLGDKLKSTIAAREEAARVAEERKRRETEEKTRRERGKIKCWLEDWRLLVTGIIIKGGEPKPIRLPRFVCWYDTGSIADARHPHHDLLEPFRDWAEDEGLEVMIVTNWDGGSMDSWWEITVKSAT